MIELVALEDIFHLQRRQIWGRRICIKYEKEVDQFDGHVKVSIPLQFARIRDQDLPRFITLDRNTV